MKDRATTRRVLLLQGPPTHFFGVLHDAFAAAGIPVRQIVFHGGDQMRARSGAIPFRGRLGEFAPFLAEVLDRDAITDVIYYADRPPYHRVAAAVADAAGVTPYVVENGYLRPDWLTLEPGGMGAYSRFPTDRARIEAIAEDAPAPPDTADFRHPFAQEAYLDVTYNLTQLVRQWGYPHFERDRAHPVTEYLSWLPQIVRRQVARRRAPGQLSRILTESLPFFLMPLQLQEDYQIRHNSRYVRLEGLIHEVFSSFARAAPPEASLLVKIHPLDNGLENWPRVLKRAKRAYGLTGRIRLMSAGDLGVMLERCSGVVLVNSTVGLTALRAGRAVKALGAAIYDMDGLTAPGSLDNFWSDPMPPDPAFVETFVRALARATQVRGSFYHTEGMQLAADEIVRRVAAGVGTCSWFDRTPPRLPAALAAGIPADPPPALHIPAPMIRTTVDGL